MIPRRVLVTGTSSGFGLLTVLELAERGHRVVATMRDLVRSTALRDAVRADGHDERVEIVELDVRDPASIATAIGAALHVGPLDAIVNNAGLQMRGAIEDTDDDEALAMLDTNVLGPMRVVRAVLPSMRAAGRGVIVNVSSMAAVAALPNEGWYCASKHALDALDEALCYELATFGVRVVSVQPGSFPTRLRDGGHTRRSGAGSPYRSLMDAFERSIDVYQETTPPGDPRQVAIAVADAIENDETPLKVPVGDDAEFVIATHRGSSYEEFAEILSMTLSWPPTD